MKSFTHLLPSAEGRVGNVGAQDKLHITADRKPREEIAARSRAPLSPSVVGSEEGGLRQAATTVGLRGNG